MRSRSFSWPGKARAALSITVDGCYAASLSAVERCVREGARPTLFPVTSAVGSRIEEHAVCSWTDLRLLMEQGCEVGSHTVSHSEVLPWPLFAPRRRETTQEYLARAARGARIWRDWLRTGKVQTTGEFSAELAESRHVIMERLGAAPESFAYAYGQWGRRRYREVLRAGYLGGRTTDPGVNLQGTLRRGALRGQLWHSFTFREEARVWLEEACWRGAWLVEVHHLIASKPHRDGYLFWTDEALLAEHIALARELGIWIAPMCEVLRWLQETGILKS